MSYKEANISLEARFLLWYLCTTKCNPLQPRTLDQKEGIEWQINALSNVGLLANFVGMLTDSRSFMSYPRHEYFRRVLCNMLGAEMERGELPNDQALVGKMVEDICFENARKYLGLAL